ncbi:MAG: hypothetical protein JHC93_03930 [Parachlamydiales bacterium]|nr:hypothetical protein [Parachlamydiales bacterium]
MKKILIFLGILSSISLFAEARLEKAQSQYVLFLEGTPYERGFQHGSLMKEQVQANIKNFITNPPKNPGNNGQKDTRVQDFLKELPNIIPHIPQELMEEMHGVADGAGIDFQQILLLNVFPEMYHCLGLTTPANLSKDSHLYHVRVLEYRMGNGLQKTATLMVVKPSAGNGYVNVSYAGFIGSITGMNAQKIAIGEIGGQGYGNWNGIPMSFLMRMVLQYSNTLDEAKTYLKNSKRTCEYWYVISDGKTDDATGIYATASQINFVAPGEKFAYLAPGELPANYLPNGTNDKFFLTNFTIDSSPYHTVIFGDDKMLKSAYIYPPEGFVLIVGCNTIRYPLIFEKILPKRSTDVIDEIELEKMMMEPIGRDSDLHNVIFQPALGKLWIAHAGSSNEPAYSQPYEEFDMNKWFNQSK